MQIEKHPIWKNVSPIKKPFHLVRLFAAKSLVNFFSPSMFVGVTGSVGKTTTTICCTHVLDQKFRTLSSTASTVVNLDPIFNISQRRFTGLGRLILFHHGQLHGQIFFRNRHLAALLAINNRNGLTPVVLAREDPVS